LPWQQGYVRAKCDWHSLQGIDLNLHKWSSQVVFARKGICKERTLQGTELQDVSYYVGSHCVTCYPTQVNAPRLTPAHKRRTRFTYPGGIEG